MAVAPGEAEATAEIRYLSRLKPSHLLVDTAGTVGLGQAILTFLYLI